MGEITLHVAQILNTEQLQHYVSCKHGFFRYLIVNTLHTSDNKDDDDDDNNNNKQKHKHRQQEICYILSV